MKAFIESQFSYCPLLWMFCSRKMNNKKNYIHERALRIVYEDYENTFDLLLRKDNSVCIHHRNIQKVAIEMYKIKNGLSPKVISDIFMFGNRKSITRSNADFLHPRIKSVKYVEQSLIETSAVWNNMVPESIKISATLDIFKTKIKNWVHSNCKCQ